MMTGDFAIVITYFYVARDACYCLQEAALLTLLSIVE